MIAADAEIQQVLGLCFSHIDTVSFCCLSSTNTSLQAACRVFAQQNAKFVLLRAARELHGGRHVRAVPWLCRFGSYNAAVLQSAADALLATPCLPSAVVAALSDAGVRFSYQEIVAAARSRVPGVEHWIEAGAVIDAPELARLACTAIKWRGNGEQFIQDRDERGSAVEQALVELQPSQLPDILYLAANIAGESNMDVFRKLVNSPKVSPEKRRQLLLQPTAPQLEDLLTVSVARRADRVISYLRHLPAAALLPVDLIISHVQRAVNMRQGALASALLELPPVQQLDGNVMAVLMQQALQQADQFTVNMLCFAPQAARVPAAAVAELLQAGLQLLQWGCLSTLEQLFKLPGVQELESGSVAAVLRVALQRRCSYTRQTNSSPIEQLLQLPAAEDIESADMAALLEIVIEEADYKYAAVLCEQPAAQQLEADALAGLLKTAIKVSTNKEYELDTPRLQTVEQLRQLPAAQEIGAAALTDLLLQCQMDSEAVALLVQLQAAQDLGTDTVCTLLQRAVMTQGGQVVESLAQLPAAAGISVEDVATMTEAALRQPGGSYPAMHLLSLPQAEAFSGAQITLLLTLAVEHKAHVEVLNSMCDLECAQQRLHRDAAVHLMRCALKTKQRGAATILLIRLPAAQDMEGGSIVELLQVAVAQEAVDIAEQLCDMAYTANIGTANMAGLLQTVMQQQAAFNAAEMGKRRGIPVGDQEGKAYHPAQWILCWDGYVT